MLRWIIVIEIFVFYCVVPQLHVSISSSASSVVAGDSVTLTCSVTLPDGVTGSPEFQWEGPGETPDPAAPSTSGQEVTSQLTLSAIKTSQAGQYICTASDFSGSDNTSITVGSELIFKPTSLKRCISNS